MRWRLIVGGYVFSLSLRERVRVREAGQSGVGWYGGFAVPGFYKACCWASLTPALSRREREKEGVRASDLQPTRRHATDPR